MLQQSYGTGLSALVVDDEPSACMVLTRILQAASFRVDTADSVAAALERQSGGRYDLIITDKNLPDGSGLTLVQHSLEAGWDCALIVMTAYANFESAVEAIRLCVADYLVKPFESIDAVNDRVRRAVEHLRLKRENRTLIGQLQEKNSRLSDLVVRDGLTGLYNHAHFQERLEAELERSKRCAHELGLLFVDIDQFKAVNDSVGHQAGDAILKAIGSLLMPGGPSASDAFAVREHDVAARYGGDEFVLLLPETSKAGAASVAERLRAHVAAMRLGPDVAPVTLSIGVAAFPLDALERQPLIEAADTALYVAKRLGRNRVISFSPTMRGAQSAPRSRLQDEAAARVLALDRSVTTKSFTFVYQPIVDVDTFKPVGYEALCRPNDPGLMTITDAIAAAEDAGKMRQLGRVLRELAIAPFAALPHEAALFVNLHPHELTDPKLLDIPPVLTGQTVRVVFEIAETVAIKDYDNVHRVVRELKQRGYRIALDDLGAGYAGLNALAQLEADFVKLDRSLIQNVQGDSRTARLIKHILEYAASEGLMTIAEGVETAEELRAVSELGCRLVQGFHVARPAPPFQLPEGFAPAAGGRRRVAAALAAAATEEEPRRLFPARAVVGRTKG